MEILESCKVNLARQDTGDDFGWGGHIFIMFNKITIVVTKLSKIWLTQ